MTFCSVRKKMLQLLWAVFPQKELNQQTPVRFMTRWCHTYARKVDVPFVRGKLQERPAVWWERKSKCDVQPYLNRQWANQERRWIQKWDDRFSQNHPQRFCSGSKMNHTCEKFVVKHCPNICTCKSLWSSSFKPHESNLWWVWSSTTNTNSLHEESWIYI